MTTLKEAYSEAAYQENWPFGPRHRGSDFAHKTLISVPAIVEGRIVFNGYSSVMGWMVSWYCNRTKKYHGVSHLQSRSPLGVGDQVAKGQHVGWEGSTGSASTGRHIHATEATGPSPALSPVVNPLPRIRIERDAKPPVVKPAAKDWTWKAPSASVQRRIQRALKARKRYSGVVNGIWGPLSIKGIQTTAKSGGYTGPINGIPGRNTTLAIQRYAAKYGGYTGPINGHLGVNSWEGFARGLEKGL